MTAFVVMLLSAAGVVWAMFGSDQAQHDESWKELELVDVVTGETFTLMEFEGSAVLVEAFATFCGNCAKQLGHLSQAAATLAERGVDVEIVAISVEVGLDPDALVAYAADRELPFRFVVASDATLRALVARFGREVINPPGTPHVLIDAGGRVSELITGFTAPETLVEWMVAASTPAQ